MAIPARFYDGLTADAKTVELDYERRGEAGTLLVRDAYTRETIARWPSDKLYTVPALKGSLRLAAENQPTGARIIVEGGEDIRRIEATLPVLGRKQKLEFQRQARLAMTATIALAAVVVAYLSGVPVLASRIVNIVPSDWERALGDTVATQMEASLKSDGELLLCDENPKSLANVALARFGTEALRGSGSPFSLDIKVVQSEIPNAFALPGGRVYVFSALLERAQSPDEVAGVLAHEIGHVAHRHGMEQLLSTAGTGALIGFILGDMTGLSVAAGLGSTLIDSRFSRLAERQADTYAASVAQRLDFDPAGLADLLARVAEDDQFAKALALFSTHPLTEDRKVALSKLSAERPTGLAPPFSPAEWSAIRTMCGTPADQIKRKTQ